jgi:hypothetical protein
MCSKLYTLVDRLFQWPLVKASLVKWDPMVEGRQKTNVHFLIVSWVLCVVEARSFLEDFINANSVVVAIGRVGGNPLPWLP